MIFFINTSIAEIDAEEVMLYLPLPILVQETEQVL